MHVSTKGHRGLDFHSWDSEPHNMPAMVTLGTTSFSYMMIDSLNRMGVRKLMVNGVHMDDTRVSSKFVDISTVPTDLGERRYRIEEEDI